LKRWLVARLNPVSDPLRPQSPMAARLVAPDGVDADHIAALAKGEMLTRD